MLGLDPWEVRPYGWQTRLNLGAGNVVKPDWTNHDRRRHRPEIDVVHDLDVLPWPWPDNAFRRIYAWAVLEHLHLTLLESLNEAWRILQPGGVIQVKVPKAGYYTAYRDPTHIWRGWDPGVWEFFDPSTTDGKNYGFYGERKWKIMESGYTDKRQAAIWARLQKQVSGAQMEEMTKKLEGVPAPEAKRVVWINGREGAGQGTLCRYLQALDPNLVIIDEDMVRHQAGEPTRETQDAEAAQRNGDDLPASERPAPMQGDIMGECARLAQALGAQGHRVVVDMVVSTVAQREQISEMIQPFWICVKHDKGQAHGARFEKMDGADLVVDADSLDERQVAAYVSRNLYALAMLP